MTEFKEALKWWNDDQNGHKEDIYPEDKIIEYGKIIRRALLIADRLMRDPSETMNNHGWAAHVSFARTEPPHIASFKAMRDQLIREIEQGSKCNHAGYSFKEHGRCCPQCGEFLTDFGD